MKSFLSSRLKTEFIRFIKLYPIWFLVLFILGSLCGYWYIRTSSYNRIKTSLAESSTQIRETLKYDNGKWDTTLYNANPLTPHPTGSSGASDPLYIITKDGFIIERNRPINGFLDSSDFKLLLGFNEPETIETITNEKWRVLSKPIIFDNETLGVIMAGYYNPSMESTAQIDPILEENLQQIRDKIKIEGEHIVTNPLDIRNSHYNVAFEVVSNFNKMLTNNGRIPTFIDKSYLINELEALGTYQTVTDAKTKEPFLIYTTPINDSHGKIAGIIVGAKSVGSINNVLKDYVVISTILGLLFVLLTFLPRLTSKPKIAPLKSISFDRKSSAIKLNNDTIHIPYASNQYYLCEAIFSAPRKRWERDELMDKFGIKETSQGWRTIYDASLAINKKLSLKLIHHQDKTFMMNPSLVDIVQKY